MEITANSAIRRRMLLIGFFQREGAADERDIPALDGAFGQVRETGRVGGDFAAAAQVNPAQEARAYPFRL